ncbi:MAG: type II toxin-antitoxin system RelE/ParE family toxin [Sphingobacteriales bacterium JAD_PAG50586_3]|nr:MAG: type II toxin-antitoxin system RelE/ParE family toxin [Sphingobacteriales bacterium JAD_PAG50586_3]
MAQIKWADSAYLDLEEIGRFIAQDSPLQADKIVTAIVSTPFLLIDYPEIGRIVPEVNRKNIRELIYGNYRIIYFLHKDVANIVAVYHAARKITRKAIVKRTK